MQCSKMSQNIKISVIKETGENIIVTVNNCETFATFQTRLFKENHLFVSIDDFKSLDENLNLDDNFFECLRKNLNDEDLLNCDCPLFEINLMKQNTPETNEEFVLNANHDIFEDNTKNNSIEDLSFETLINENLNNTKDSVNYLDIVSQLKEIHNYSDSEESISDYCRLCATNLTEKKIKIFNEKNYLAEKINQCLPVKVNNDDGLPQFICEKCAFNLGNLHEFVENAIEAEKILKLKFTNVSDLKQETFEEIEEEYLEVEEIEEISNTYQNHCRICDLILDNIKDAVIHSSQDHKINNLYACVFCEYGFKSTLLLTQHIQSEHKDFNKYICKICDTRFVHQHQLQKHICAKTQKFLNVKIEYPCDICNQLFTTQSSLTLHKKSHYNKCEICFKVFADKQTLKDHAVTHMDTKPFQCHVCGKNLNRLSRLKSHLLTHESMNLIVKDVHCCIDCKEGFENEQKAILHHNNTDKHTIGISKLDRVFRCEFCEKCFISIDALKLHRKMHNLVNPYVCHICNARFSTYSRCTTHKTCHGLFKEGGDKQIFPVIKYFLCNSCDNTYLNWTHLASHKKLKHSISFNTYKCLDCNLEFPTNYGLTYHRKTKHIEDAIKCSECGENLANYEAWKEHRLAQHANKKYNYQCVKCNKIFHTQETLEEHLKIHTDLKEDNKCPYCPLSFGDVKGLGVHLKIHRIKKSYLSPQNSTKLTANTTNSRPFCCDDCGLTFRKQFTLKNHKLKHCTKLDKTKFVLMVDLEEDEAAEEKKQNLDSETIDENETSEQYIDLGDGNYVRVEAGNTVNIEGNEYVFVEENDDQSSMVDQFDQNTMLVDQDNYMIDSDANGITYLLTDHQTY